MPFAYNQFKPVVLTFAMLLAVTLNCTRASAAPAQTAIFAGGCFWCVESDFESVPGVIDVVSGFIGGKVANPSYKEVTKGGTGHVEAAKITYDPARVDYAKLVSLFFRSVDPTDAGGQFCDRGASYATAIFVSNASQNAIAKAEKASAQKALGKKIVTPIRKATTFYPADASHQDYYKKTSIVLTRFGPRTKAEAYKRYRKACGRDKQVQKLWGKNAPFIKGQS